MKPLVALAAVALLAPSAFAAPVVVNWTDWQSGNGTVATGLITTATSTVNVTYTNPQSYSFLQTGSASEVDYFTNGFFSTTRDPSDSAYTSSVVANIPTAREMIGLNRAGTQTLEFSQTIANPFFSYVSLNGNGYAFDQDFDILSFGHPTSPDGGNDSGYWGSGTSYKSVVDLGGGNFEYQLLGTGEPHGTIRFKGTFDTVTWRSLSNENWNGFTVGIEGTKTEVFGVPDSGASAGLIGLGLISLFCFRRRG